MRLILFLSAIILIACEKTKTPFIALPPDGDRFSNVPLNYFLSRQLLETSGIADSKAINDHLWVIEDSGNPPVIFLMKHEGFMTDSFYLKGGVNRDWEEVVVATGPDDAVSYLYVGDIGDNASIYPSYTIYRMPEPKTFADTISVYDSIRFTYPDGSHDAEAFLVDDATKDIYIVTKRDAFSKIYKIPFPQDTENMNQAQFVADLNYSGVVGSSLSAAGTELILKTYSQLYYYTRTAKEGLAVTMAKIPTDTLAYQLEPQGEAVAFANNNSGFFTLSEKGLGDEIPNLLFYRRTR